jgi:H+/Cl- antiporter ClcA
MPGLLASGIGALVFIGVDSLVGLGAVSLAIPGLPEFDAPNGIDFLWAIVIGIAAAVIGTGIRWLGLAIRPLLQRNLLLLTPVAGIVIAGLAILYSQSTGHPTADVLFSGESDLPVLITNHADYAWGALALLLICKGLGYGISLAGFRGGPVFPSMFLGATIGLLLSTVATVSLVPAVAMGIGAMCACMLRLPLTSVLLATLLLGSDGLATMPVVIVAVVVSYMLSVWLAPPPDPTATAVPVPPGTAPAGAPSTGTAGAGPQVASPKS